MDDQDEIEYITKLMPVDVTAVRDDGIKSLVMLAVSLGWNAHHKHNQPMIITARDGVQKRLPTNTSIRMSVFQTALSTILAHTEEHKVPTIELVDTIILVTKPSVDHQRRLRLAVGESPGQHRERVAAAETEMKGAREPQPLTTRIELPVVEPEWAVGGPPEEPATQVATEDQPASRWDPIRSTWRTTGTEMEGQPRGPADNSEHGTMVSREPFQATRNTSGHITTTYTSDTSYERKWEDGYVDYECMVCGNAYATPKGVGSHSQVHDRSASQTRAWKRADIHRRPAITVGDLEWEEPPEVTEPMTDAEWEPFAQATGIEGEPELTNATDFILGRIAALVAPDLVAKIQQLEAENQFLKARLEELEGEFDAFLELAASRRKKPDGG